MANYIAVIVDPRIAARFRTRVQLYAEEKKIMEKEIWNSGNVTEVEDVRAKEREREKTKERKTA